MWGKAHNLPSYGIYLRITPTHVGKRPKDGNTVAATRDHPHPCGEKHFLATFKNADMGSPPPMWGKDKSSSSVIKHHRITPTHVGKSKRHYQC